MVAVIVESDDELMKALRKMERNKYRWRGGHSPLRHYLVGKTYVLYVDNGIITRSSVKRTRHYIRDVYPDAIILTVPQYLIGMEKQYEDRYKS